MRENAPAIWAFAIQRAIGSVVKDNFPEDFRSWPLLQGFNFEAYEINKLYVVVVLRDKLGGIPSGPGVPASFGYADHPSLPPLASDVDIWQRTFRAKLKLSVEDAAILIPTHDSGVNDASKDYEMFSAEEQDLWNRQLSYVVSRYKAHLDATTNRQPGHPMNITYYVSGTNTRVNINSVDSSVNIVKTENTEIFDELREMLPRIDNEEERARIATSIDTMESTQGTADFLDHYQAFVSVIANHVTVFGPWLAALAAMLTS